MRTAESEICFSTLKQNIAKEWYDFYWKHISQMQDFNVKVVD